MVQEKAVNAWPTGLKELVSGVYAHQQPGDWGRTNAGLIVGEDYAIVVDTQFTEELTLNFINEIRSVTDKPVRYIVHTHHHGDHVHGDHLFADAQVVCHDNCCRTLLSRKAPDLDRLAHLYPNLDFSGVTYPKPEITFSQSMSIYQGNRRIDLIYFRPAHSPSDIVIFLPEENIVFCGDILFLHTTPLALESNFEGWIRTLEELANMNANVYVPGHGPVCSRDGVIEGLCYLTFIYEEARKRYDRGMSAREAIKDIDLGKYRAWATWERIIVNVERLYCEFCGQQGSFPAKIPEIMAEVLRIAGRE